VSAGLGGGDYCRVRLGSGRPPAAFRGDPADWVLTRFVESREDVQAMVARATDMVEVALAEGMPAAIERFHATEPGAKARRRHGRRAAEAPAADEPDE
jgi:PTH1 family peptidyl-tRNA hydrolase